MDGFPLLSLTIFLPLVGVAIRVGIGEDPALRITGWATHVPVLGEQGRVQTSFFSGSVRNEIIRAAVPGGRSG